MIGGIMKLNIAETFLLIAIFPEKGKFWISDIYVSNCLIGAILFDLTFENVLKIENNILLLSDNYSLDNNYIYNDIISELKNSRKNRKVKYWIGKFSNRSKKYKLEILRKYEENHIVTIEHKKFLGLIPYNKPILFDKSFRQSIIEQLHDTILYHNNLTQEVIALLNLIKVCEIQHLIAFDKSERKMIKSNIKNIIIDNPITNGVNDSINEIHAAIISAVIASSVASSVASGR
jgi:golgi phosphoprotein 3